MFPPGALKPVTRSYPLAASATFVLMKTAGLAVLLLATNAFAQNAANLRMLPGERWWAGVISASHLMPFTAESQYQFDFDANTAGNQGQPLLISDKGRFLWCDPTLRVSYRQG